MITTTLPVTLTPNLPAPAGDAAQTGAMFLATLSASVSSIVLQTAPVAETLPLVNTPTIPQSDPSQDAIALAQSLNGVGITLAAPAANDQLPPLSQLVGTVAAEPKVAEETLDLAPAPVVPSTLPPLPRADAPVLEMAPARLVSQIRTAPKVERAADMPDENNAEDQVGSTPTQVDAAPVAASVQLSGPAFLASAAQIAAQSTREADPVTNAADTARPEQVATQMAVRAMPIARPLLRAGVKNATPNDEQKDAADSFAPVAEEKSETAEKALPVAPPVSAQAPELPQPLRPTDFVTAALPNPMTSSRESSRDDSTKPVAITDVPKMPQPPVSSDLRPTPSISLTQTQPQTSVAADNKLPAQIAMSGPAVTRAPVAKDVKVVRGASAEPVSVRATDTLAATATLPANSPPSQAGHIDVDVKERVAQPEVTEEKNHAPTKPIVNGPQIPDGLQRVAANVEVAAIPTHQVALELPESKAENTFEITAAKPADAAPLAGIVNTVAKSDPIQMTLAPLAMPPVEHRQLDLARNEMWLDQLAQDIVATRQDSSQLSFRLAPETLGRLDVKIDRSAEGLSVHMVTSSAEANAVVAAAQPRLIEELKSHGARVVETQVRTGDAGWTSGNGGSQRNGQNSPPPPTVLSAFSPAVPSDSADNITHPSERFA